MARIQQSIDVGVPMHTAFMQLTHFEDYPQFLQNVESVQQIDDTHYHWQVQTSRKTLDWDSEITERRPDECIRWRNNEGPIKAGSVELEPMGVSLVRVTMTYDCDPLQMAPVQDGNADRKVAERMQQDLQCFKSYVETHESQASDMIRATDEAEADLARDARQDASPGRQASRSAQSENSLSGKPTDVPPAQPLNVSEEVAFDQQSKQARQVGHAPEGSGAAGMQGEQPLDAMADALKNEGAQDKKRLDAAINRNVPKTW